LALKFKYPPAAATSKSPESEEANCSAISAGFRPNCLAKGKQGKDKSYEQNWYKKYNCKLDFKQIDAQNIEFYFSSPYAPMYSIFTLDIVPKHILESHDILRSKFNIEPIGTGPFVFSSWEHDEMIHLTANQEYFKGRPYIDHFIYKIIPDSSILFFEMMRGKIDFMQLRPELYYTVWEKNKAHSKIEHYKFSSNGFTFLGFNLQDKLFSNLYIRKAINLAIDKSQITKNMLLDTATPALSPFRKKHWAYDKKLTPVPYSPTLALNILEKNGWKKQANGYLIKDNKPLILNLVTNRGSHERQLIALFIKEELKKIGISVHISTMDWGDIVKNIIPKRNFSALLLGVGLGPDPDDIYSLFHSSQIKNGMNFFGYKNALVDSMLAKARVTLSREKRAQYYKIIQQELTKDLPLIFLYHPDTLYGINSRIHGITPTPESFTHNIEKWYISNKR
jgi:peptide/nickel transport system substrate-binding protein